MLPTPQTDHVNYGHIYEPSEDSYLLLDTLSSAAETTFLATQFPSNGPSPLVLEVGSGSGVVLAFVTAYADRIFDRSDICSIGTDLNRFACAATMATVQNAVGEAKRTGGKPGVFLGCINADLTSTMKPCSLDVLIFNPPYVPSETLPPDYDDRSSESPVSTFARDSHLLSLSTDGGADGMEVTNRLLAQVPSVLSNRGVAYVLLCAQNKPDAVIAHIRSWLSGSGGSWMAEKIGFSGKKAGWERLCVIRIWRVTE